MVSNTDCPHCVELAKVHKPFPRIFYPLIVSIIIGYTISVIIGAWGGSDQIELIGFWVTLCITFLGFTVPGVRRSRFFLTLDNSGHMHVHEQSNIPLDAQLVITVNAGLWPHKCKLHGDSSLVWTVKADNEHLYFVDKTGAMMSVRYCAKLSHTRPPRYRSEVTNFLPKTLQLITYLSFVSDIQCHALLHLQADTSEPSAIAGNVSRTNSS